MPESVESSGTKYPVGKFTYISPAGIADTGGGPAEAATAAGIACAVVNENGIPTSEMMVPVTILQYVRSFEASGNIKLPVNPSITPVPYPSAGAIQPPNPPFLYVLDIHILTNNTNNNANIIVYLSSKNFDIFIIYVNVRKLLLICNEIKYSMISLVIYNLLVIYILYNILREGMCIRINMFVSYAYTDFV